MLKPTADLSQYANLLQKPGDDEYVVAYQAMTRWAEDHIPFPGAAARQTVDQLLRRNGCSNDDVRLGGEAVHLSDVDVPVPERGRREATTSSRSSPPRR